MASHWPLLKEFVIYQPIHEGNLNAQRLGSIGRSCPKLQRLILFGAVGAEDLVELLSESENTGPIFPDLRDLDIGWRLFPDEHSSAANFFVEEDEKIFTQIYDPDGSLGSYDSLPDISGMEKSLAPGAIQSIASRVKHVLFAIAPQLRLFRSSELKYIAVNRFLTRFESNVHADVLGELKRSIDTKHSPPRCDSRGYCECWRLFE